MSDIFNHEDDAWASLIDGEDEPTNYYPKPKKCKYCGETGFYWYETEKGWRLLKKGYIHQCSSHVMLRSNL